MGVEQLDAVSVRIAQVNEQRMPGTVPTRTKFDVGGTDRLNIKNRDRDVA